MTDMIGEWVRLRRDIARRSRRRDTAAVKAGR